jgi:hypothetical protein
MPHTARLKALLETEVKGRILPTGPVVKFSSDPDWDDTIIDFSDPEYLLLTQLDEDGKTHTIVISERMVSMFRPHLLKWLSSNNPQ